MFTHKLESAHGLYN